MFPPSGGGALLGRAFAAGQIEGGIDQRYMRKRLRKIPDLALRARVVFLCQQAEIVAEPEQPFEKAAGLGSPALQNVIIGEPEAAGQKSPFPWRQPIDPLAGIVAQHEPVDDQALFDRLDRADHARVGGRQKAHERQQQKARIERLRAVGLDKTAELAIERLLADVGMDLVAQLAPALGPAAGAEPFGDLDRPVEGDPGHHLRMGEMLRWPAHLPDTLVRLIPDLSQMLKNDLADCGAAVDWRQAVQMGLVERIEDLTKDIELNLVRGVITDADRP